MATHLDQLGEVLDTSHRDSRAVAADICMRACAGSGLIHPGSSRDEPRIPDAMLG